MFGFLSMSSDAMNSGEAIYTIRDSMFRQLTNQVLNCNLTPASGGHNIISNVANCAKITVNISNNVFIDNDSGVASNNNIIVPQIKSDNVYFNITDNIFKVTGVASENFIAIHGATDSRDLASRFVVTGNTFDNIPTAISLPNSTTEIDMSNNTYRSPKDDPAKSVIDGVPSVGTVDKTAKTLTDSVKADEYKVAITTNEHNTFAIYSDKELTKELTNPVKLYKETNTFYIKIMSANGVNEEVYTATVTTTNPAKLFFDIENEVHWLGRTYSKDGMHFFNWSASGFEFTFKGSGVRAEIVSNAPGGGNNAYIKVFVNGVEQPDIVLTKAKQTVTLAEGLDPNNTYTIRVVKRSNARSSTAALVSLKLNDGEKLAPPTDKDRLIEFVGDSITVGYSASAEASSTTSWSTATEDGTKTYSEYIAKAFGADYHVIAVSGRGIARNYGNTTERLIPLLYASLDDYNLEGVKYDFKRQADVIVINAGTNDASGTVQGLTADEFKSTLKAFLLDVRAKNPNAEIIYAYGMMGGGWMTQIKQVVEELRTAGDTHINFLKLKQCTGNEKGIASHPTAESYISRGDAIIELIEQTTGWKAGEVEETTTPPETTVEPTPDETSAPEASEEVTEPAVVEPDVTEPEEKGGCGASAMSAAAVICAAAAAVALKKKKED
jgi:lysophospholipase L1-like esterase